MMPITPRLLPSVSNCLVAVSKQSISVPSFLVRLTSNSLMEPTLPISERKLSLSSGSANLLPMSEPIASSLENAKSSRRPG